MAKQIDTNTKNLSEAIKVLENRLKQKIYRRTIISGTCVGVQFKNGDEWLLTVNSYYPSSDIVFEKLRDN